MGCRVGITTRPALLRDFILTEYKDVTDWQISGPYRTRVEAVAALYNLKLRFSCPTGPCASSFENPRASWYTYYFRCTGRWQRR